MSINPRPLRRSSSSLDNYSRKPPRSANSPYLSSASLSRCGHLPCNAMYQPNPSLLNVTAHAQSNSASTTLFRRLVWNWLCYRAGYSNENIISPRCLTALCLWRSGSILRNSLRTAIGVSNATMSVAYLSSPVCLIRSSFRHIFLSARRFKLLGYPICHFSSPTSKDTLSR